MLSTKEVADHLGVTLSAVKLATKENRLPCTWVAEYGRLARRFELADVEEYRRRVSARLLRQKEKLAAASHA